MLMHMSQTFTIKVAQAHPTTPKAGKFQMPKVNAKESGIFRPKAIIHVIKINAFLLFVTLSLNIFFSGQILIIAFWQGLLVIFVPPWTTE